MEGFLQSLKFCNPAIQEEVCKLVGVAAKFKGKKKKWWRTQTLYWQGKEYNRHSQEYQDLLDRAYDALAKNQGFRDALIASQNAHLTHSIGKSDPHRTILTSREFCSRLTNLRTTIMEEERYNASR
jgi:hypothetical protein